MTVAEELIVAGTTSVTSNSRYGDYSQLSRDPNNDLVFWFTAEYSGEPRKTRIASFKISSTLSADELDLDKSELIVTSSDQENFEITLFNNTTRDILRLSVYDALGNRVIYEQIEKSTPSYYRTNIDMSAKASGVYIVELGNAKTKVNSKIIVR